MNASETKLQPIIEGTKQYVIPLFQRQYSWDKKEWEVLWNDLVELTELEVRRSHFIGSMVTMPTTSVPEGVSKYLLIDGQQRLTTIFVLMALLRDASRLNGDTQLADEINQTLLVNPYKKDSDYYKLLPTAVDRQAFWRLCTGEPANPQNQIVKAYQFFERKLRQSKISTETLKGVITNDLSVVSIVLGADDNPHLVFESLNAKGRPLTQADLIRNYFFMRIHVNDQDQMYAQYWEPMQAALGESLTEYIRHYLMRSGSVITKSDVYFSLKEIISKGNAVEHLKELSHFADHYKKLLFPKEEPHVEIRRALSRINRIEVTVSYPFLLNCYENYHRGELSAVQFLSILNLIENFMIRRFVCNMPTNSLSKIFPLLYSQALARNSSNLLDGVRFTLQTRGYPKNAEFRSRLADTKLYGGGDRTTKTKLILETIEESFEHKEQVPFDSLTIEHVMPQTLTEQWQIELGNDWEITHELLLHTLGNLTLTAYNPELSNDSFEKKKERFNASHLEMNEYFSQVSSWTKDEIERRASVMAERALTVWPYFGDELDREEGATVTGKTPNGLWILGQSFEVQSWRDVLEATMNTIAELEPEKFEQILHQFPRFVAKDKKRFRAIRELRNGAFIEVNLSAQAIQRFCLQALETIDLTSEDWRIEMGLGNEIGSNQEALKAKPLRFQDDCIPFIAKHLGMAFEKKGDVYYLDNQTQVRLVCLTSKGHERATETEFWFGFSPIQRDYLSQWKGGSYIAYGCGTHMKVLLFPFHVFEPYLDNMSIAQKDKIKHWHVHIFESSGLYYLAQPLGNTRVEVTEYLISDHSGWSV
jgi:uncharacterized protein with ParB-like and HNH nuclease domain